MSKQMPLFRPGRMAGRKHVAQSSDYVDGWLYGRNNQDVLDVRDSYSWDTTPLVALSAIRRVMARSVLGQSVIRQYLLHGVGPDGPSPILKNVTSERDRDKLKEFWDCWSMYPTVSGDESWGQFLRIMVSARLMDGRAFGILRRNTDYEYGLAIQPIGREYLDGFNYRGAQTTADYMGEELQVDRGVGRGPSGRVKAYYFYEDWEDAYRTPWNGYSIDGALSTLPRGKTVPIKAEDVLDFFTPTGPHDLHGSPGALIPVINMLQQVSNLDDYTLETMKASTIKGGFLKSDAEARPIDNYDDPDAPLPPPVTLKPGLEELPSGYEFQPYDPKAPNANIYMYRRELVRNLSAAIGLTHANVSGDLSQVNFSSTRQGELQARDNFQLLHKDMECDVCRPAFYKAVETAWMMGHLNIGQKSLMECRRSDWRHRQWAWVDPWKDAAAAKAHIAMGVTSPQAVCSALGNDPDSVLQELKDFKETLESLDLNPSDLQAMAGSGTFDEDDGPEGSEGMVELQEQEENRKSADDSGKSEQGEDDE